jgi:hypothetical protein
VEPSATLTVRALLGFAVGMRRRRLSLRQALRHALASGSLIVACNPHNNPQYGGDSACPGEVSVMVQAGSPSCSICQQAVEEAGHAEIAWNVAEWAEQRLPRGSRRRVVEAREKELAQLSGSSSPRHIPHAAWCFIILLDAGRSPGRKRPCRFQPIRMSQVWPRATIGSSPVIGGCRVQPSNQKADERGS